MLCLCRLSLFLNTSSYHPHLDDVVYGIQSFVVVTLRFVSKERRDLCEVSRGNCRNVTHVKHRQMMRVKEETNKPPERVNNNSNKQGKLILLCASKRNERRRWQLNEFDVCLGMPPIVSLMSITIIVPRHSVQYFLIKHSTGRSAESFKLFSNCQRSLVESRVYCENKQFAESLKAVKFKVFIYRPKYKVSRKSAHREVSRTNAFWCLMRGRVIDCRDQA